jgi:hypothetical protein
MSNSSRSSSSPVRTTSERGKTALRARSRRSRERCRARRSGIAPVRRRRAPWPRLCWRSCPCAVREDFADRAFPSAGGPMPGTPGHEIRRRRRGAAGGNTSAVEHPTTSAQTATAKQAKIIRDRRCDAPGVVICCRKRRSVICAIRASSWRNSSVTLKSCETLEPANKWKSSDWSYRDRSPTDGTCGRKNASHLPDSNHWPALRMFTTLRSEPSAVARRS